MALGAPLAFLAPALIAEDLASALADQIIFGDLKPGQRLTEEWVEGWSGVSRSPIREAFRLLEHEGLIRREARRGVAVAPISIEDLDEVYTCRIVLEGLAAELAATNATAEHLAKLQECFQAMSKAASRGNPRDYFRANVAFSVTIHAASGNATLRRLLSGVEKRGALYRYMVYEKSPVFTARSVAGGGELLDAIKARDSRRAKKITKDLIQSAWTEIRTHLDRLKLVETEERTPVRRQVRTKV